MQRHAAMLSFADVFRDLSLLFVVLPFALIALGLWRVARRD